MAHVLLYVTTAKKEEALAIGQSLLEERLAACVNIWEGMTSLYWWQGKIENGQEVVLIVKTRQELSARAIQAIISLHSAACPCVVELPVTGGNPGFLSWIEEETASRQ